MQNLFRFLRMSTLKSRLLIWLSILVVAICLFIMLFLFFYVRSVKVQEVLFALQESVNLRSKIVDQWSSERLKDIEQIADSSSIRALDMEHMNELIRMSQMAHREFDQILYISADGLSAIGSESRYEIDFTDRSYYLAAKNGKSHKSDALVDLVTNRHVLVFSAPVRSQNGSFAGLIAGMIGLDKLDSLISGAVFNNMGEVYMLNREGYRMTKPRGIPESARLSERYDTEIVRQAAVEAPIQQAYRSFGGQKVFGAYAWSQDDRYLFISEVSAKDVFAPYNRMLAMVGIIMIVFLIVSWAAGIILSRHIVFLIWQLRQGMKLIRQGEFGSQIDHTVIEKAPAELKELSDHFNIMSEKLKSTVQLLRESAMIDSLTEIYNRRFLMSEGSKIEEAARSGIPFCVLLIDVDDFKQINDTYGHLTGDRVLQYSAAMLVECVRQSDIVARYGGEEFVILANNCRLEKGRELAERIRSRFAQAPFLEGDRSITVTVSIGVAQSDASQQTNMLIDMISRADKALYRAKTLGRNRVEIDESAVQGGEDA